MAAKFGTDGIRGRFPEELSPEDAFGVGVAVGRMWQSGVVVGCDPRESSPILAAEVIEGLVLQGCASVWLGVVPTPAVAFAARLRGWPGIVITASHNLHPYNGIKVFSPKGLKLEDDAQQRLEELLEAHHQSPARQSSASEPASYAPASEPASQSSALHITPKSLSSQPTPDATLVQQYSQSLRHSVAGAPATTSPPNSNTPSNTPLAGLHIVVDCAHGAHSDLAPQILRDLGAKVDTMGNAPDGRNINAGCGSTSPQKMAELTKQLGADFGLSLDGDGDRLVMATSSGEILDGDNILAILARYWLGPQAPPPDRVDSSPSRAISPRHVIVITPLTNLGLRRALTEWGFATVEVPVGDRNIHKALQENGWRLGGEQSGHILMPELSPTGDGLLTALQIARIIQLTRQPLDELANLFQQVPQILRNIPLLPARQTVSATPTVSATLTPETSQKITDTVAEYERQYPDSLRIVVRPSGTEPLIRIMVETEDTKLGEEVAEVLANMLSA